MGRTLVIYTTDLLLLVQVFLGKKASLILHYFISISIRNLRGYWRKCRILILAKLCSNQMMSSYFPGSSLLGDCRCLLLRSLSTHMQHTRDGCTRGCWSTDVRPAWNKPTDKWSIPLEELGHALQNFAKKHLQPSMIFSVSAINHNTVILDKS